MSLSREEIFERLKAVIDPEVGLNIIDMGLVYEAVDDGTGIRVEMTLTTPGCPMSAYMISEVRKALGAEEGGRPVEVVLVWSPPWTSDKIRPEALEELRNR